MSAHRGTPRKRPALRRTFTAGVVVVASAAGSLAGAGPAAAAGTWYVATTGANTATCGTAPATPCATVTFTVAKAAFVDGDTVNVAVGTYTDKPLFAAKGANVVGQGAGATFSGTNSSFAVGSILPAGKTLKITNLTLTAGKNSNGLGGGLAIANGGAVVATDVTVTGNNASNQGGGAYVGANSSLTMNGGTVADNTAAASGGGIYNAGTVTLVGTTVQGNSAVNGGGLFNVGTAILKASSTVDANTADGAAIVNGGNGGGVLNAGSASLADVSFSGNRAIESSAASNVTGYGGAVFNGPLTVNGAPVLNVTSTVVTGGGVGGECPDDLRLPCDKNAVVGGAIANVGNVFNLSGATAGKLTATQLLLTENVAEAGGGLFTSGATKLTDSLIGENSSRHESGRCRWEEASACRVPGVGGGLYVAREPASGPVTAVTLEGTSVTQNRAILGGGLVAHGGTAVQVRSQSLIAENSAGSGAGAASGGSLTVTESSVSDNTAEGGGGGVSVGLMSGSTAADHPSLVLDASRVDNNTAGGRGGGVAVGAGATLDSADGHLTGNSATAGGAVYIGHKGTASFDRTELGGNTASYDGGGAVYNSGSTTITRSSVFDNHAVHTVDGIGVHRGFGGAIFSGSKSENAVTTLRVTASAIYGNDAYAGSALEIDSRVWGAVNKTSIDDSTIHGNTSSSQRGAIEQRHPLTITNSTITGNTAASGGWGGLAMWAQASVGVAGTILAGNAPVSCSSAPKDGGHNLAAVGDTACGFTAAKSDVLAAPQLGALADNGGLTPTRLPDPSSPVLGKVPAGTATGLTDAITGSAVTLCGANATDQRGVDRPQGAKCDMGAVEVVQVAPTVQGPSSEDYTETVAGPPVSFTTTGTPLASLSVTGALPDGVTIHDNGDGTVALSGTPAPNTVGVYPLVVKATNEAGTDTLNFTLTVHKAPLVITTPSLPDGTVGTAYTATVQAKGGHTPYSFSLASGSLPTGLSLSADGTISGTPTGPAGNYSFTVKATDTDQPTLTDTKALSVEVAKGTSFLSVDPVVLEAAGLNLRVGTVKAALTGGSPAQPFAGQPIVFKAGATTVCTAVTAADGSVTCKMNVANTLLVILHLGVTATYAGNDSWLPSSGSAGLFG